jgi:hypothetical protein
VVRAKPARDGPNVQVLRIPETSKLTQSARSLRRPQISKDFFRQHHHAFLLRLVLLLVFLQGFDAKENKMKAAELFVKCLENEGVEYIFGVPGEENVDIMDALMESPIRFITTRHEQGAAFMADVYGRLIGKAGV